MKEYPIIFSGDHPRKILDGIKIQTRRTWGLNEINKEPDKWKVTPTLNPSVFGFYVVENGVPSVLERIKCPYGQVGDRLWVRERHIFIDRWGELPARVVYSDGSGKCVGEFPNGATVYHQNDRAGWKWRPSIHMFRWASRITLEITEVRVERVQEISQDDAIAEGIEPPEHAFRMISGGDVEVNESPKELFSELWDSLNAKRGYGWEVNPWVFVISFKVVK